MKDEAYIVNLDDFKSIETRQIVFYPNDNIVTFFDRFGDENIFK